MEEADGAVMTQARAECEGVLLALLRKGDHEAVVQALHWVARGMAHDYRRWGPPTILGHRPDHSIPFHLLGSLLFSYNMSVNPCSFSKVSPTLQ